MREQTMFSWTPIHQEATRKMLAVPEPQKELLATLREMEQQGLKVIGLRDQDPQGSWLAAKRIDQLAGASPIGAGIFVAARSRP